MRRRIFEFQIRESFINAASNKNYSFLLFHRQTNIDLRNQRTIQWLIRKEYVDITLKMEEL